MVSTTAVVLMAFLMMSVGGASLYFIVGGGRRRPQGVLEWTGTVLSGLLVACSALLLLLAFSSNVDLGVGTGEPRRSAGAEAESFAFRLVSNDTLRSLDAYDGDVVLLNFWATWCAPCREEMPALSRLQETYGPEGLSVLTISDETRQTLRAFDHDAPLATTSGYLRDPKMLPAPFDEMRRGRPVSFLIDREGRIQGRYVGARSYQFFEQAVSPYL